MTTTNNSNSNRSNNNNNNNSSDNRSSSSSSSGIRKGKKFRKEKKSAEQRHKIKKEKQRLERERRKQARAERRALPAPFPFTFTWPNGNKSECIAPRPGFCDVVLGELIRATPSALRNSDMPRKLTEAVYDFFASDDFKSVTVPLECEHTSGKKKIITFAEDIEDLVPAMQPMAKCLTVRKVWLDFLGHSPRKYSVMFKDGMPHVYSGEFLRYYRTRIGVPAEENYVPTVKTIPLHKLSALAMLYLVGMHGLLRGRFISEEGDYFTKVWNRLVDYKGVAPKYQFSAYRTCFCKGCIKIGHCHFMLAGDVSDHYQHWHLERRYKNQDDTTRKKRNVDPEWDRFLEKDDDDDDDEEDDSARWSTRWR
jgi:hypothetical protein